MCARSAKIAVAMTASRLRATLAVRPALDRLAEFSRLESDWDSYGGSPPSAAAIAAASRLVLAVAEHLVDVVSDRARPYAAAHLADGSVQITWRGPVDELEVEIGPGESIGYLLITERGSNERYEDREDVLPAEILKLVARVLLPRTFPTCIRRPRHHPGALAHSR
jgi:hypothetical protein